MKRENTLFNEGIEWILFAGALAFSIVSVYVLENLYGVVRWGFVYPLTNEPIRFPDIIYHLIVTPIGIYLGIVGIKKLVVKRRFTTELLMSIASLSALYIGYVFEASTVLLLFSIAEYLEVYIQDRAKKSVEGLVKYIPNTARVVKDGRTQTVDVDSITPGQFILVKPGERIPLDGVIVNGISNIDESLVTGESMPVPKKVGDEVYGGTLNLDGVLKIRVTKPRRESLVSKIVELVFQARARKARIENLVDRFVKYYVPIVIIMAVTTASLPPLLLGGEFDTWIYRSLILLVIACPSAFIISVPATFFTSLTLSSRKGVIIKGGKYLEGLGKVDTILLDKTGTLTLGEPTLMLECRESIVEDSNALKYAAYLERFSNHPIASAFVKWAEESGVDLSGIEVRDVRELAGKGIVGYIEGSMVGVGNRELLKELGVENGLAAPDGDGHTKVYIVVEDKVVARVCLADRVREDAKKAIKELKRLGVQTIMLTGDKRYVAESVARELEVDKVYAELHPVDKLNILREFKGKSNGVVMVGDGINDAPALAEADVGVAMGDVGVDITLEAADVVLIRNILTHVPYLIRLGRKTREVALENIILSLGVKLVLGILGILGLIPLWIVVAIGDDGITLLLFGNIIRLKNA